jgi:hypothetical protein
MEPVMRRIGWMVPALMIASIGSASNVLAQKRVALVIGNSAYQHTTKLANPKNDAIEMAASLKKVGFAVVEGFELDKAAFDRKLREFAAALKGADTGLLFYAGHGLQVAGQNFLVPTDAKAEDSDALEFEMVRVDIIHRIMERHTQTNILFLDACRDNPLARSLARGMGTRSAEVTSGLARIESGVGTLISFSTQPGNVALDGTGRNSPYTAALVKYINSGSGDLGTILISVRNDVMKETQRKQVPWENSALTGQFFFKTGSPFDGTWSVSWRSSECRGKSGSYLIKIEKGAIMQRAASLDDNGSARWIGSAGAEYTGALDSKGGSGTFRNPILNCGGTWTAGRAP